MELTDIKGIGAARAEKLNSIGIIRPTDLLLRFPDLYLQTAASFPVDAREGDGVSFRAVVKTRAVRSFIRRGLSVTKMTFLADGVSVVCSWFNMPFMGRTLEVGDEVYICGTVKRFKGVVQFTNPLVRKAANGDPDIIPVYKINGFPSKTFAEAVSCALKLKVSGFIPDGLRAEFALPDLITAITSVHFPKSMAEVAASRRALAIEDLSYMISTYRLVKKTEKRANVYQDKSDAMRDFIASLPYELTGEQARAVNSIVEKLKSGDVLNALIQGDVGCGKTVIAICAMYFAALNGYQSVLMAPTEILARQHYANMINILERHGVRCELVCGSLSSAQRQTALFNVKYGNAKCVVGTHALIGEDIVFDKLSLVITDEQQRFGVNQRAKLQNKAETADSIVMTATPIPRTLAMAFYGELDQITVKGLPARRAPIKTSIVPSSKISGMFDYILKKAEEGEQTYLVCSRIETDENLTSCESLKKQLGATELKPYIGVLHGKMKETLKNSVMEKFKRGEIKVLISTTVVEVGIDVPNATTAVIFDADRYGLSELHQIRGRVGRGDKISYCFLLSENDAAIDRIKQFTACRDGFELAELDFTIRGAGDFIGTKQHGGAGLINTEIIDTARALSDKLVKNSDAVKEISASITREEFIKSVTMN